MKSEQFLRLIVAIVSAFLVIFVAGVFPVADNPPTGLAVVSLEDDFEPNEVASFAPAPSVERSLPASVLIGSTFDVNLAIKMTGAYQAYLIDEQLPQGFSVIDSNGGSTSEAGHIKWADYNSALAEKTIVYRIKAPSAPSTASFSGNFIFEDLALKEITGAKSLLVREPNVCDGKADGTACGDMKYCCGQVCVASPSECPACQLKGNCCSGATAICCSEPSTKECGTTACPASQCTGPGGNNSKTYPLECQKFCSGGGVCSACTCVAKEAKCGNTAFCSDSNKGCAGCELGKANCDLNSANGCEVEVSANNNHCGTCGHKCASGWECTEGKCIRKGSKPGTGDGNKTKDTNKGKPGSADGNIVDTILGIMPMILGLMLGGFVLYFVSKKIAEVAGQKEMPIPPKVPQKPASPPPASAPPKLVAARPRAKDGMSEDMLAEIEEFKKKLK